MVGALLNGGAAGAAMTPAGTVISNVAHINYTADAEAMSRASNQVDIRVGEIIDFSVTPAQSCEGGASSVGFRITNLGNGPEAFIPGTPFATDGSNAVPSGVAADSNDNGCYDPDIDQLIPSGGKTPPVPAGRSLTLFILHTGGNGIGKLVLPVTSATGSGRKGKIFAGGGEDGGDAVIGDAGGEVEQSASLASGLTATLIKSQSVRAPDGSAKPRRGAIITYRIESSFAGSGDANDVAIADAIPTGTSYIPDSLMLDNIRLSDAADGDNGTSDDAGVAVRLGKVTAPAVHAVTFEVRIN